MIGKPKPWRDPLPAAKFAISERNIETSCTQLLGYDGWRHIVTDPPQLRGLGVSEPGIPDRLYIRYRPTLRAAPKTLISPWESIAEVLWIEWKKKGGKASQRQSDWIAKERADGALVWLAGIDFPASHDGFLAHYRASGLNRRPI